jgi:hypothetical protein
MLSGVRPIHPEIVGWSTAPRGQVINESLGQVPKKLVSRPARAGKDRIITDPIGYETGWTIARSLGEVGTTSVHSNPVFACNDCTFLDELHRATLEKNLRYSENTPQACGNTRSRHSIKPGEPPVSERQCVSSVGCSRTAAHRRCSTRTGVSVTRLIMRKGILRDFYDMADRNDRIRYHPRWEAFAGRYGAWPCAV